ncbi:TnpV protein [Acetobacterium wieringae]|uniref:TnpV protein n=1 Tax=Acetobacterium wieringae TaxID=52694 RepID=UPI00396A580B
MSDTKQTPMLDLDYVQDGDFLSPVFDQLTQPSQPIGKYGRMHDQFLEKHHPSIITNLIFSDEINEYLVTVDQNAKRRLNQLMAEMQKATPGPDRNIQPLEWAAYMKMIEKQAEEIVLQELIYVK